MNLMFTPPPPNLTFPLLYFAFSLFFSLAIDDVLGTFFFPEIKECQSVFKVNATTVAAFEKSGDKRAPCYLTFNDIAAGTGVLICGNAAEGVAVKYVINSNGLRELIVFPGTDREVRSPHYMGCTFDTTRLLMYTEAWVTEGGQTTPTRSVFLRTLHNPTGIVKRNTDDATTHIEIQLHTNAYSLSVTQDRCQEVWSMRYNNGTRYCNGKKFHFVSMYKPDGSFLIVTSKHPDVYPSLTPNVPDQYYEVYRPNPSLPAGAYSFTPNYFIQDINELNPKFECFDITHEAEGFSTYTYTKIDGQVVKCSVTPTADRTNHATEKCYTNDVEVSSRHMTYSDDYNGLVTVVRNKQDTAQYPYYPATSTSISSPYDATTETFYLFPCSKTEPFVGLWKGTVRESPESKVKLYLSSVESTNDPNKVALYLDNNVGHPIYVTILNTHQAILHYPDAFTTADYRSLTYKDYRATFKFTYGYPGQNHNQRLTVFRNVCRIGSSTACDQGFPIIPTAETIDSSSFVYNNIQITKVDLYKGDSATADPLFQYFLDETNSPLFYTMKSDAVGTDSPKRHVPTEAGEVIDTINTNAHSLTRKVNPDGVETQHYYRVLTNGDILILPHGTWNTRHAIEQGGSVRLERSYHHGVVLTQGNWLHVTTKSTHVHYIDVGNSIIDGAYVASNALAPFFAFVDVNGKETFKRVSFAKVKSIIPVPYSNLIYRVYQMNDGNDEVVELVSLSRTLPNNHIRAIIRHHTRAPNHKFIYPILAPATFAPNSGSPTPKRSSSGDVLRFTDIMAPESHFSISAGHFDGMWRPLVSHIGLDIDNSHFDQTAGTVFKALYEPYNSTSLTHLSAKEQAVEGEGTYVVLQSGNCTIRLLRRTQEGTLQCAQDPVRRVYYYLTNAQFLLLRAHQDGINDLPPIVSGPCVYCRTYILSRGMTHPASQLYGIHSVTHRKGKEQVFDTKPLYLHPLTNNTIAFLSSADVAPAPSDLNIDFHFDGTAVIYNPIPGVTKVTGIWIAVSMGRVTVSYVPKDQSETSSVDNNLLNIIFIAPSPPPGSEYPYVSDKNTLSWAPYGSNVTSSCKYMTTANGPTLMSHETSLADPYYYPVGYQRRNHQGSDEEEKSLAAELYYDTIRTQGAKYRFNEENELGYFRPTIISPYITGFGQLITYKHEEALFDPTYPPSHYPNFFSRNMHLIPCINQVKLDISLTLPADASSASVFSHREVALAILDIAKQLQVDARFVRVPSYTVDLSPAQNMIESTTTTLTYTPAGIPTTTTTTTTTYSDFESSNAPNAGPRVNLNLIITNGLNVDASPVLQRTRSLTGSVAGFAIIPESNHAHVEPFGPIPPSPPTPNPDKDSDKPSTSLILGIILSLIGVAIIIAGVVIYRRRKRSQLDREVLLDTTMSSHYNRL